MSNLSNMRLLSSTNTFLRLSCNKNIKRTLTNEAVQKKRSSMFTKEVERQRSLISRIEKIEVEVYNPLQEKKVVLLLNKGISTPYNVLQHLHSSLIESTALTSVNDQLWDLHRPIEEDSSVKLLHFKQSENSFHVNKAFWRSCSLILGSALESLFDPKYFVQLHSYPAPNVNSGRFIYDVDLSFEDWVPQKSELMACSARMQKIAEKELPFERLTVDASLALEMFEENKFKHKQIPSIAAHSKSGNTVTLYRIGDYVDISGGPMVGNTGFLGRRCTISAAHRIEMDASTLFRFQGVALPRGINLDTFSFGILEKRSSEVSLSSSTSYTPVTPS